MNNSWLFSFEDLVVYCVCFIIDKARTDLGYEPRSFAEGLAVLESQL